jgi:flavin reductase (DIM6/NTAB) family NADH-FMN oxidoreductase RutF
MSMSGVSDKMEVVVASPRSLAYCLHYYVISACADNVVKPPRIKECCLHLECKLLEIKEFDDASIVLGRIVAHSSDKEVSFERGESKESIKLLSEHPLLAHVYLDHYTKISLAEEFIFPRNYKP